MKPLEYPKSISMLPVFINMFLIGENCNQVQHELANEMPAFQHGCLNAARRKGVSKASICFWHQSTTVSFETVMKLKIQFQDSSKEAESQSIVERGNPASLLIPGYAVCSAASLVPALALNCGPVQASHPTKTQNTGKEMNGLLL